LFPFFFLGASEDSPDAVFRWLEGISSALLTGWIRVVIFLPMSMAARVTPESLEARRRCTFSIAGA
jgi:hypothetical protein